MLKVVDIHVNLGGLHILRGVNLEVRKGEIVALVGSNGAGKTTLMNSLSGLVQPTKGLFRLDGKSIERLPPHKRVVSGLVLVPEGRRIFPEMTVLENLEMGGYLVSDHQATHRCMETVYSYFPRLKERLPQLARTLSGGEQQMLAIGRSLMSQPKMLMLDEPSLGLAPLVVKTIFNIVAKISEIGVTILLVEQNVRQALNIAHRGYVMENGVIVDQGESKMILQDARIMKAYLGI